MAHTTLSIGTGGKNAREVGEHFLLTPKRAVMVSMLAMVNGENASAHTCTRIILIIHALHPHIIIQLDTRWHIQGRKHNMPDSADMYPASCDTFIVLGWPVLIVMLGLIAEDA